MSGFLSSLFAPAAPAAPETPAASTTQQAPAEQAPAATGQVPGTTTPPATAEPANPLDAFKDLFTPPTEEEAAAQQTFDPSKIFNINPEQIKESVSKLNFAQGVTQEQVQAIQAGGEEATRALLTIMNTTAQNAFMQAMMGSAQLVQQGLTQANNSLDARLQQGIKQQQFSNQLLEANPALNHPAAAPILDSLKASFAAKFPQASSTELAKMAQEYLSNFAQVANPQAPQPTQPQGTPFSWDNYMN